MGEDRQTPIHDEVVVETTDHPADRVRTGRKEAEKELKQQSEEGQE